ncbi:Arogenate dehydrogenase 1 [Arachis hypogaea]|nr:Arogenate dehydrogenase 1 [Arachis hypogaea]
MVDMSGEDHNRYAAGLQFITYTVGRILEGLMLESMPINMKGYQSLLGLVENTVEDSFDLYYGLFMFNKNSLEVLEKFDLAFGDLKKQLIARMHHVVRNQLMENGKRLQQLDRSNNHALLCPSDDNTKLKIAIVGFGNFGQFLAKTIVSQAHGVLAYSRSDYSNVAGIKVLKSLPFQRLKRSTLFADVLSVKEFPRNLFLQHLLPDFDVLCTHPMFGLQSGKNGCKKLPLVYEKVRIRNEESRILRCYGFLDIFASEGLQMVEMSCAKHDWHVAGSQFVTHTTGRFLEKLGLETTPINTKGYETLLSLAENIEGDSFDL